MEAKDASARRLGLGIDTGGTFTDAAVVDMDTKKVLAKAKAPTTHYQLSKGILSAVDSVIACGLFEIEEIALVGISTTLATNSVLEGLGGEVGLIGIGWEPKAGVPLGAKEASFIGGSFDVRGREVEPLDLKAAERAVARMAPKVQAFAVSGIFGVLNPSHEEVVRDMIIARTGMPAVVGHELTAELGIEERSITAVLNARLLSVIRNFVDSVEGAIRQRCIRAPIMIYKGDGSLMSLERARYRPVETVMSGPAASLMGGLVLSGIDTCVVLDIGGTSTDIAFLDEGFPRLSRTGATVGHWRTKVRATDVWTAALGGDSRVGMVDGRIVFGPERVVPLGVAVEQHPRLLHKMQRTRRLDYLVGVERDTTRLTTEQRQVVRLLLDKGPMDVHEITSALPDVFLPRNFVAELKSHGQVASAGLTPTDLLNVAGQFSRGSRTAAELGAEIFAHTYDMEKEDLVRDALALIGARMAEELLLKLIEDGAGWPLEGKAADFLMDAMTSGRKGDVELKARLSRPVIGIGAPAGFFVPSLEGILGTKVVVPEHHDVGNAVGAVCSQVYDSVTVQVHSRKGQHFVVAPFCEPLEFDRLERAVEEAVLLAKGHVEAQVRSSGGVDITTKVETKDHRPRVTSPEQGDSLNWVEVKVRATGRPDLSGRQDACAR